MRTKKLDFLRTLGRSKSVCLYRCAKKGKFMLCVQKMHIVLVPIQRKIKFNMRPTEPSGTNETGLDFAPKHFNLVPGFPGYEIAQRLIFLLCIYLGFGFRFFWGSLSHHYHFKTTQFTREYHYAYILCYIPLHCVTSGQQSFFSGFRPPRS